MSFYKHGFCPRRGRHPIYRVWEKMKQRCSNKKEKCYENYGGRGITVCDEWAKSFPLFIEWAIANRWKHGLDIDRIDNDKGYSPDNCRFVDRSVNNLNTRVRRDNTSGYRCVYRQTSSRRDLWHFRLTFRGKTINYCGYSSPFIAAVFRDIAVLKHSIPKKIEFPEILYNMPV